MEIIMKRILATVAIGLFLLMGSTELKAQTAFGAGVMYGFDMEETAIQFNGYTKINRNLRLGADFGVYLIPDEQFFGIDIKTTAYELNGVVHYIFQDRRGLTLYGLGLVGIHGISVEASSGGATSTSDDSELALGVGAGAEVYKGQLGLFAEPRVFLSGFDQFSINFGFRYRLRN
jgi:hypothetical protein